LRKQWRISRRQPASDDAAGEARKSLGSARAYPRAVRRRNIMMIPFNQLARARRNAEATASDASEETLGAHGIAVAHRRK